MKRCIAEKTSPVRGNRTGFDRESTLAERVRPAAARRARRGTGSAGGAILVVAAALIWLADTPGAGAQEPVPGAAPSAGAQEPVPEPVPATAPSAPTVAEAEALEVRLQAAIRINPSLASLHASLGELYRSQARVPEARDAYSEAVRLEPMNPEYRLELARAHLALDEFVEAEVNFAWGTELAPQEPAMHTGLGEALIGQGRPADAEAALHRAAELAPRSLEVERLLAMARAARPSTDETGATSTTIVRLFTRFLTYFFAAALVIAGLGLLLPVAAAVIVLILFLPRAILQRRRG